MIFLLAKKDYPKPKFLTCMYKNDNVCLYLDSHWKTTNTGFYKGHEYEYVKIDIADNTIDISMPFYHQSKTYFNNNTGLLLTNNHCFYDNDTPCSIDHFKYDGQSHFTESIIPDFGFEDITFDSAAKIIEEKIAERISAACSKYNKSILFFSGGLDTAVVLAIIKKYKFPISINYSTSGLEIPDLIKMHTKNYRTPLYNEYLNKYVAYKESIVTEPFTASLTGFVGGIETLRFPHHASSIMNCFGLDYHEELNKHSGSYLYNFHISETIPDDFPIYEGTDLIEAKKFVLNQILHNKEILSIDYHNIISPWRVPEIPQLMLGLSVNDLTQQTFHSTIHKVIIENTFPDIIKMVPDQKYESINNYKAFPPNKRRWGDIN